MVQCAHLEKYEFANGKDDILYIMENKIHVPNHQLVMVFYGTSWGISMGDIKLQQLAGYEPSMWKTHRIWASVHHVLWQRTRQTNLKSTSHSAVNFRIWFCLKGWQKPSKTQKIPILVGNMMTGWWYTYPSEKYESQLGWLFPNIWENKSHVPNHQPVMINHWNWGFSSKLRQTHILTPLFPPDVTIHYPFSRSQSRLWQLIDLLILCVYNCIYMYYI